jgi:ParB-like chromosome segregation protein Spo0J
MNASYIKLKITITITITTIMENNAGNNTGNNVLVNELPSLENATATQETKRNDMFLVDIANIEVDTTFNARESYGDLLALGMDIAKNGLIEPFKGYKKGEKFHVVDGFRRYHAILTYNQYAAENGLAPIKQMIKFIVSDNIKTAKDRLLLIVRTGNDQFKKNLNRIEEAKVFLRLVGEGMNKNEIAEAVGKSYAYVNDSINLVQKAPLILQKAISQEIIKETAALTLYKDCGGDENEIKYRLNELLSSKDLVVDTEVDNGKKVETPASETTRKKAIGINDVKDQTAKKAKKEASDTSLDNELAPTATPPAVGNDVAALVSVFESVIDNIQEKQPNMKGMFLLEDLLGIIATPANKISKNTLEMLLERFLKPYNE